MGRALTIFYLLISTCTLIAQDKVNALVVKNDRTITIENGKKKVFVDFKMIVFNSEGDKYGLVEIPYSLGE